MTQKPCKYCQNVIEGARSNQVMCKRCRRLHRIEYQRVYDTFKRQGIESFGSGWRLKQYACPFCNTFILGRRYCKECARLRDLINETIVNEVIRGVKNE